MIYRNWLQWSQRERGSSLIQKVYAQFDAALVDEFQDTDPLQFNILKNYLLKKNKTRKSISFTSVTPSNRFTNFGEQI